MPQDVDTAIIRADLEEHMLRPLPGVEHFGDDVLVFVEPKANRPLISLPPA
jgi:hypothetical protein